MKLRLATPEVLVDVSRLEDLAHVTEDGDELVIGALTRYHHLIGNGSLHGACTAARARRAGRGSPGPPSGHDRRIGRPWRLGIGSRGGGARVVGDPGRPGHGGRAFDRRNRFFMGSWRPRSHDRVLTEIRVPKRTGLPWGFEKFRLMARDWAMVGWRSREDPNRVWAREHGPTPVRATRRRAAHGAGATPEQAAAVAATAPSDNDRNASAEYRRHLARVLTRRASSRWPRRAVTARRHQQPITRRRGERDVGFGRRFGSAVGSSCARIRPCGRRDSVPAWKAACRDVEALGAVATARIRS